MFDDVSGLTNKILCTIAEPVILFNEEIKICWINPAAEILFEHSTEFLSGKDCTYLFPSDIECSKKCPVRKSHKSGKIEHFIAERIDKPERMIESIPFVQNGTKFVLAIIHNVPDIDKNRSLKCDFASELNKYKTLSEAMLVISSSIFALTAVTEFGIYTKGKNSFELFSGTNVPSDVPQKISKEIAVDKPLYLATESQTFVSSKDFPAGVALIPIYSSSRTPTALLLAGSDSFLSNTRDKLEMIASVLSDCITRFL